MSIRPMTAALAAIALLAACSDEQQELRGWMEQQRRNTPVMVTKIEPPKQFAPFRYEASVDVDPFSQGRISLRNGEVRSGTLEPDMSRRREVLESYPLESIRMVGHMGNGHNSFALLQAEGMVYQARVGNHAGQNLGVITFVSDSEVKLRELVRDAAGDWVHRDTSLELQESTK